MRMILIGLVFLFCADLSWGQKAEWIIMAKGGSAYNFKTPLTIRQNEYEDIKFQAKYATKPFAGPPYYDFQIIRWNKHKGWGLKSTHHKLYLKNNPPSVQRFTITDGFNLLTITRQWQIGGVIYHLGGGVVITHPESTIRGRRFSETKGIFRSGYHLSGPVAEVAVEKRIDLTQRFLLSLEGRVTGAYVKVPVANGHALVPHLGVHGLIGIGYKF